METPEHILQRLQKLLNKAEGARELGSIAEAEAFAIKAQEIMAEYNLTIQDIKLGDEPNMGDITIDPDDIFPKNEGAWIKELYHTIAFHNYCRAINYMQDTAATYPKEFEDMHKAAKKGGYTEQRAFKERFFTKNLDFKQTITLRLIGESHNVEMAQYIIAQLINRARPLAKQAWKEYQQKSISEYGNGNYGYNYGPMEKKGQFIRGFLSGFVMGISMKLSVNRKKMESDKPQLATMAVTIYNKVDEYYDSNFKSAGTKTRGGHTKSEHGQLQGVKKGLETEINKGLGTNELNQKLLG